MRARHWHRHWRSERGSGSVLAVGVIGAIFALSALIIPVSLALAVKHRVEAAADAAALAAANTASGRIGGYPCHAAGDAAAINGATLGSCTLDGVVVTVTAHSAWLGFTITAKSRAGPPGS